MLIVMRREASASEIARVTAYIEQAGCQAHITRDDGQTVIGVAGNPQRLDRDPIEALAGVQGVMSTRTPFKRASREFQLQSTEAAAGRSL